jgi:hypothetical protein
MKYTEDDRPARGLWAPGKYLNHSHACTELSVPANLCTRCADCEYAAAPQDVALEEFTAPPDSTEASRTSISAQTSRVPPRAAMLYLTEHVDVVDSGAGEGFTLH